MPTVPDAPVDYTQGDETKARAWRRGYEAALNSTQPNHDDSSVSGQPELAGEGERGTCGTCGSAILVTHNEHGTFYNPLPQPHVSLGEAGQDWLLGPGGQVVDGPSVEENIAVVPQHRLDAAEELLREIARGVVGGPEGEPWRRRNAEAVQMARGYFDGRTITETPTQQSAEEKAEPEKWR